MDQMKKNKCVDLLKNSLLSYAIFHLKKKDIDFNYNMNYDSFDRSTLPSFSGYNTENAILSYMNTPMAIKNQKFENQGLLKKNQSLLKNRKFENQELSKKNQSLLKNRKFENQEPSKKNLPFQKFQKEKQ